MSIFFDSFNAVMFVLEYAAEFAAAGIAGLLMLGIVWLA